MKKRNFSYWTLPVLFIVLSGNLNAQTPLYDQNWHLDSALSDEFSQTSLDLSKWDILDCGQAPPEFPWGYGQQWNGASNAYLGTLSNGNRGLILKCENSTIYCSGTGTGYKSGGIRTYNTTTYGDDYSFGYIEIYSQLPGYVDSNGVGHADKFWPAFWTYAQLQDPLGSYNCHDEVDVMDECCSIYHDGKTIHCGAWGCCPSCSTSSSNADLTGNTNYLGYYTSPSFLCDTVVNGSGSNFHKIGMERDMSKIIFYVDDVPTWEWYRDSLFETMVPQAVVIDLQLAKDNGSPNYTPYTFDPNTPWTTYPMKECMQVDYFHYYTLILDCSTSVTMLNNTDLANFSWGVKSAITFGNGSNSISLTSGDHKVFRAVSSLTVNGTLTVPVGAEFSLIPTPCN